MATTVAQPGTALRKIAKTFAAEAGMPVAQFLEKLKDLNPDYNKTSGSDALRLGRGVGRQQSVGNDVMNEIRLDSPANMGEVMGPGGGELAPEMPQGFTVADILDSPLYTQNLKDYYLSQYLPGLTQATFNIGQARTELGSNEADRARQRGEAIKRVAGGYAARGMRSPGAINKDRSEIQSEFAKLKRAEQNRITSMENERDIMFGAGAEDSENFLSNPNLFGSIGAGARRNALSGLQQLPELYNLLGLGPSTTPMMPPPAAPVAPASAPVTRTTRTPASGVGASQEVTPATYTPPPAKRFTKKQIAASEARRDAAMAARAPMPRSASRISGRY